MADNSELMTDLLPEAFITCTSANPEYYVTIKTQTLKEAQRWHDAVLALSRRTPVTAGAGEVSEAEVEAALQAYFGDGHPWRLSMGAAVRVEVLDGMRAALIAARRVQPKQDARDSTVGAVAVAAWRWRYPAWDADVWQVSCEHPRVNRAPGWEQNSPIPIIEPLYTAASLASASAEILEGVALMLDARASAAISVRMERIIRNDAAAVRALAFVNKTPVRPG